MGEKLKSIIKELYKVSDIISNDDAISCLRNIEYYSANEQERAYLLGLFFKNRFDISNLPHHLKRQLQKSIKTAALGSYFYLKQQPEKDQLDILSLIFFVGSFFIIAAGIIQLINGNFWVGLGTKYVTLVVREGGQKIILGILLFIGGVTRYRYERRKKKFIATLNSDQVLFT